jgi:predicted nicotinamide N-methyase
MTNASSGLEASSEPKNSFVVDEAKYRLSPPAFQCGEILEEDGEVGSVVFCSTTPNHRLEFSCRGRSVGVLNDQELGVSNEELEEATATVDPFFFDKGYTLAGRTGFQIWAGARIVVESLIWPLDQDPPRLVYWQQRLQETAPCRIIELGSGVGLLGASLAAQGGEVLATDLPTLVENAIYPNQQRNKNKAPSSPCPEWLASSRTVPIGNGWLGSTALDWTKPVQEQLSALQRHNLDLIVASDCVWLVSMLDALLDTVASLFHFSPNATFLMSFQRRDLRQESALFTTVDAILDAVRHRGWELDCLSWKYVKVDGDEQMKEVFLFEIRRDESFHDMTRCKGVE